MRKNISGKSHGWAKHSRNVAVGKRGVNKRQRQTPLPDIDEPAAKPKKKASREKRSERPYFIEFQRHWPVTRWVPWASYETAEQRDKMLAKALRGIMGFTNGLANYRAVDKLPGQEPVIYKQQRQKQ
jgi:hypothetical protein